MRTAPHAVGITLALCLFALISPQWCTAQVSENLLSNPSFEDGLADNGIPIGWSLYMAQDENRKIELVGAADEGDHAALIHDDDPGEEIGIHQSVPAEGGLAYEASVMVRRVEGAGSGGSHLQLRFFPSDKFFQVGLDARSAETYTRIAVIGVAPEGTTSARIYLYTHRSPTPKVMVDSVSLVSGVEPPPPPPPPPSEITPPVYDTLKDLHLTTSLVKDGEADAVIVAPASGRYDALAARIQSAIADITGATPAIVSDDSPEAAVPIKSNLIALGNRSTNATLEQLYNLFYCLLDLKYPGAEGYVVRTLHNPFGDGKNVIFVGGSDDVGVEAATGILIEKLGEAGGGEGALSVDRLMEIQLGKGIEAPRDVREMKIWEASRGYKSSGYFGWCSISKHMAMYYMTGDEFHAREALRLSFPDAQALAEITEIDQERIENKDDPLAGFYHYNAHMAILFWELIEESPAFTDEERLAVTNAFSRQLDHRKNEGIYTLSGPPAHVGSRHGQWSAISSYCLGRYFDKDYPDPIWAQCVRGAELHFAPLHKHAWVSGENDNLFWYNTAIAPIFTYLALTGDREPVESGAVGKLLRGQEALISGLHGDWALNSASLGYLNKAAYITGDGRWLTYRERTGVDTDVFRLGQSFWPDENLTPAEPTDLVGKWSINHLPEPHWLARRNGFEPDESIYFASYRSAADDSGDFILIDGFNGASRNPYHTFAILELRLAGSTLLKGYLNQVLIRADGMVEPQIAMDAALRRCDVVGETAFAIADVPRAAFCNWRRALIQRTGKYALIVDDLTFRTDSENLEVQMLWETPRPTWNADENALTLRPGAAPPVPPGWTRARALASPYTSDPAGPADVVRLDSLGIVLLRATEPGQWLEMTFTLDRDTTGEVFVDLLNYKDRGNVRLLLDGRVAVDEYAHNTAGVESQTIPLGKRELAAGDHKLRVEVIEKRGGLDRCYIGLSSVTVRPEGAPPADARSGFRICPSEIVDARVVGSQTTMEWVGPVSEGEHRIFFSLVGTETGAPDSSLACVALAGNAAALALPQPAVAVVGKAHGIEAGFAVVAEDHLFGTALTAAGILQADKPVDVDWDLQTGVMHVVAEEETTLTVSAAVDGAIALDGRQLPLDRIDGDATVLTAPAGRHTLSGLKPDAAAAKDLVEMLTVALDAGRTERAELLAAKREAPGVTAPALTTEFTAEIGGGVRDAVVIPSADGPLVCAAEGSTVHILRADGTEARSLEADADIRVLRWWDEHKLLLVGCVDEQVIAFDESGERRWVFTSVMDPAVFRAAKQYWFKSAPGHEGIHGLHTGEFDEGKSRAFVGSACTLEIIDENGELVKRMPIFWGPGHKFALIDGPEDSIDLLIARQPTDSERLAIVNSKSVSLRGHGFQSVPPGHRYVGSWAQMSRNHIFHVDLDGNGEKEIVSEVNGVWNRVTVWSGAGEALHGATFGPGRRIPYRNIRDLDIADLDGDGKQEILVATDGALVVALNRECNKLWSKRLPSAASVMKAITPAGAALPLLFVGCDDGTVLVLDGQGEIVRMDSIAGTPTRILQMQGEQGPVAVMGTSKGQVKGFVR